MSTPIQLSPSAINRFWTKVKIARFDECWNWQACKFRDGYGQFRANYHNYRAHRVAYTLYHGDIPDGLVVCHTCDNRLCCNPSHMFLGTIRDNSLDAREKGRLPTGERNGSSKLTYEQVAEIRALYATGNYSQMQIAAMFHVHQTLISAITRNVRWISK